MNIRMDSCFFPAGRAILRCMRNPPLGIPDEIYTIPGKDCVFNMNILAKLFGNYSKKELKRIEPLKEAVLALDDKYTKMTDNELKGQTEALKERLSIGASLDDILPEAFATCREAMWRVL